jgi:DNA repair protein RadC
MKTIKKIEIRARRIPVAAEDREIYGGHIDTPDSAAAVARAILEPSEVDVERFAVLVLDAKLKVIGTSIVATGGVDRCPVEAASVFRPAILLGGGAVIIAHNHPSGDPSPSGEDISLTRRMARAGKILGVEVIDHVIVTATGSASLAELGFLPNAGGDE